MRCFRSFTPKGDIFLSGDTKPISLHKQQRQYIDTENADIFNILFTRQRKL